MWQNGSSHTLCMHVQRMRAIIHDWTFALFVCMYLCMQDEARSEATASSTTRSRHSGDADLTGSVDRDRRIKDSDDFSRAAEVIQGAMRGAWARRRVHFRQSKRACTRTSTRTRVRTHTWQNNPQRLVSTNSFAQQAQRATAERCGSAFEPVACRQGVWSRGHADVCEAPHGSREKDYPKATVPWG